MKNHNLELIELIKFAWEAHTPANTRKKSRAFRFEDNMTTYAVHPVAAALCVAQDVALKYEIRMMAAKTLVLHDCLEDTTLPIPYHVIEADEDFDTVEKIKSTVLEMTYENDDPDVVRKDLPTKSTLSILCKIYDCFSNIQDADKLIREFPPAKNFPALCWAVYDEAYEIIQQDMDNGNHGFLTDYAREKKQLPNVLIMAKALFDAKIPR